MNAALLAKVARRELRRRVEYRPPDVLAECFPEQVNFITSAAKKKILCLTRRAGKSTSAIIYLIIEALKNARAKLIYINLTKEAAKSTAWFIFEDVILKHKIQAELVGLEIRFSNGSIIYLTGGDATPKEMDKLRGKKYQLAVVDECQSFTQDLRALINKVLGPTLADANATICLCGTAGNQMGDHYWWQLNRPGSDDARGWEFFIWRWQDNPHARDNVQKFVDDLIAANPLVVQAPWFRQEYLGEWVIESDARVYRSGPENYVDAPPAGFFSGPGWTFNLSIDLGYTDATAFVESAFNQYVSTDLWIVGSMKRAGMTISAVAAEIKERRAARVFSQMVVDAANKQAVEEMRQIHALPLIAAEKQGKEAHIALMNSDLTTRNVKIVRVTNPDLIKELDTLIWDPKAFLKGEHHEDPRKDNHLTDALLYAHHASRHYWSRLAPKPKPPEVQIEEEIERQFAKPKARQLRRGLLEEEAYG